MPNPKYFKTKKEYLNWYRDYREKNREKLRKYNINIIAIVLAIDFVCAVGWAMSGQTPTGNLYFGAITTNLLRLI